MPSLNLKLSTAPGTADRASIAERLTSLTAEVLGKKPELTAITVESVDPATWFIGGRAVDTMDRPTFVLEIKVTAGTNVKDEKADYVNRAFAVVESMLGPLHPASYVVIHEVAADSWGYGGRTQEHRYIEGKRDRDA